MFELENGRKHFFQWDTGQRLIIADATVIEAHFCNRTDDCSLTCEVYTDGGKRVVDVPNILLQDDWDIRVYAFCGNYTKVEERFEVITRSRPADYVYTETQVKSWDEMEDRVNTTLSDMEELANELNNAEYYRDVMENGRQNEESKRKEAEDKRQEEYTRTMNSINAAVNTAINTLMSNAHADAIVAENTSSIVRIDDAAATLAVGATTHIAAAQAGSGDASPTNIRAISGRNAAKIMRCLNLMDTEKIQYPSVYISGNTFKNITAGRTITIECEPNTTYTVSKTLPSTLRIATSTALPTANATNTVYVTGDAQTTELTITSGASDIYLTIQLWADSDVNKDTNTHLQTLKVYKTDEAQTLTVSLPETVYGGNYDWNTGLLTITHRKISFTGEEDWRHNGGGQYYARRYLTGNTGSTVLNGYCSHYRYANAFAGVAKSAQGRDTHVWIKDADIASVDDLKAYLAAQATAGTPVELVYPLATSYTIQLTPQQLFRLQKGYNYVYSDCGGTTISYIADTKLYIDGKFAELQNAIVSLGSNV